MATNIGDIVIGALGEPREVVSVENANDYIQRKTRESGITYRLGGSAGRCALYGTTKQTTAQEKRP